MSRPFRVLALIVLAFSFSGCGSETPAPPTGDENKAVQDTAAKMPPPPGTPGKAK